MGSSVPFCFSRVQSSRLSKQLSSMEVHYDMKQSDTTERHKVDANYVPSSMITRTSTLTRSITKGIFVTKSFCDKNWTFGDKKFCHGKSSF